jgi:hypothetical protein
MSVENGGEAVASSLPPDLISAVWGRFWERNHRADQKEAIEEKRKEASDICQVLGDFCLGKDLAGAAYQAANLVSITDGITQDNCLYVLGEIAGAENDKYIYGLLDDQSRINGFWDSIADTGYDGEGRIRWLLRGKYGKASVSEADWKIAEPIYLQPETIGKLVDETNLESLLIAAARTLVELKNNDGPNVATLNNALKAGYADWWMIFGAGWRLNTETCTMFCLGKECAT